MRIALLESDLTHAIIGGLFEVYRTLGFGFLERIYQAALEEELRIRGHKIARQVPITVAYKQEQIGTQRVDMIVDDRVCSCILDHSRSFSGSCGRRGGEFRVPPQIQRSPRQPSES